jgi:hypothetical protein
MALRRFSLAPFLHQGVHARLRRAMERVGVRGLSASPDRVESPLIPTFSP